MGQTLMPGAWLLAFARLIFSDGVMASVIEPTIADLRIEWSQSIRTATRLRARLRGYAAFWTIVAVSPIAFAGWPEQADTDTSRSNAMTVRSRIGLILILTIAGIAGGYVYGRSKPFLYRSSALIQYVPPRVPAGIVMEATNGDLGARLQATSSVILSRTRLERIIREFNLYSTDQQSQTVEDIVGKMRISIDVTPLRGDVFRISYAGTDPTTVMKVTERLVSYFIEESLKSGQRSGESTLAFLEGRIQQTAARLATVNAELDHMGHSASAMPKRLELEVIQDSYKNLIKRREEALGMNDLERRSIGERYTLLDAPEVAERPIGPQRAVFILGGGAIGLGAAILVLLGRFLSAVIRRRRDVAGATV